MGLGLSGLFPAVLYFLGIVALILVLFYKVEAGLFYLVPILPLQNVMDKMHNFPAGKDIVDILVVAMIIKWFLTSGSRGGNLFVKTDLNMPLILLILITFFGLLRGSSYLGHDLINFDDVRFLSWKNLIIMPLLYFITVNNIKTIKNIKVLSILMILSMILMDLVFINTFRFFKSWHFNYGARIVGTFSYLGPNELAAFYTQYTLLMIGILIHDHLKIRKLLFLTIIMLNTYCIIYLYSRAAYFASLMGLIIIGAIKNKKTLILVMLFLVFWTFLLPVSVQERIDMTQNEEGRLDSSANERIALKDHAIKIFREHPIVGIGYKTFSYTTGTIYDENIMKDTHNMYLNVLSELGIVGFTLFMILYLFALKNSLRLYRDAEDKYIKGLGFGFSICVIANMALNVTHDNWSYINLMGYYWVFLGLVVRANIIINEEKINAAETAN